MFKKKKNNKKPEKAAPQSGSDENIYVHASTFDHMSLTQHDEWE